MLDFNVQRPSEFILNPAHSLSTGLQLFLGGLRAGGDKAYDSSPYCRHCTLTNMDPPTDWVAEPSLNRYAVDFDGSGDVITTPIQEDTGPITLAAWVFPRATTGSQPIFAPYPPGTIAKSQFDVRGSYNVRYGHYVVGPGWISSQTTTALTGSTWTHVAVSYDEATHPKIYFNGILQPVSTASTPQARVANPSYYYYVGGDNSGNYANSRLSDVLKYTRVLSVAEIQLLANSRYDPTYGGWIVPVEEPAGAKSYFIFQGFDLRRPRSSVFAY